MVSDAILGAIVGGGFAVAGSAVQAWFNRQNTKDRIDAGNKRKKAEYILEKETDFIFELLNEIQQTDLMIRLSKNWGPEFYQNHNKKIANQCYYITDQIMISSMFVREETYDALLKLTEAYTLFSVCIATNDLGRFDLEEYTSAYTHAIGWIQVEMGKRVDNL